MTLSNLSVIIRSVGERTVDTCRRLLAGHVPAEDIVVVSNAPFSATLADCYRAGIARGRPWTLCIDADVLVAPGRIAELVAYADRADPSVCEVQGLVLDKFFGIRRPAGNHLYRTSLLPQALELIPVEGDAIRPEHETLTRLTRRGCTWVETPVVLGLHDFEQHDRDIFRKCYVHARKFGELMHHLVDYWRRRAPEDRDYRVALAGLAAGIADPGEVRVDVRRDGGFAEWATRVHWTEKGPLAPDALTIAEVERTLANWTSPGPSMDRYEAAGARLTVHGAPATNAPRAQTWRDRRLVTLLPWAMGRVLGKAGRRLERLGSS